MIGLAARRGIQSEKLSVVRSDEAGRFCDSLQMSLRRVERAALLVPGDVMVIDMDVPGRPRQRPADHRQQPTPVLQGLPERLLRAERQPGRALEDDAWLEGDARRERLVKVVDVERFAIELLAELFGETFEILIARE